MGSIKKRIKSKMNTLSSRGNLIGLIYLHIIRSKRKLSYKKLTGLPTDDHLIVFEAFMGRRYADSPKAIYEYLLNNDDYADYRFIWVLRGKAKEEYSFLNDNPQTETVNWGSRKYYESFARAKYWVSNTRIPESVSPKPEQVYLQCWHGTPLKKLGFDIKESSWTKRRNTRHVFHHDAKRYTYLISPSRYFTEHISSAFDLEKLGKESVIIETGYPRNDFIVNHDVDDAKIIRERLCIPKGNRVILYAPTYRDGVRNEKNGYAHNEVVDFDRFFKAIGDGNTVLFRAHYYIDDFFDFDKYDGRIIDVTRYPEINDLFIASDLLITDYSSVLFDYSILNRPIVFYMHNPDRGMYMNLNELPGPVVTSQDELEEKIKTVDEWTLTPEYREKYDHFSARFTYLEDGNATQRVVETVFNKKEEPR